MATDNDNDISNSNDNDSNPSNDRDNHTKVDNKLTDKSIPKKSNSSMADGGVAITNDDEIIEANQQEQKSKPEIKIADLVKTNKTNHRQVIANFEKTANAINRFLTPFITKGEQVEGMEKLQTIVQMVENYQNAVASNTKIRCCRNQDVIKMLSQPRCN